MAKVVWLSHAIDDVRDSARDIGNSDPAAARNVAARLFDPGDSLVDFPRRGRPGGEAREPTTVPPYILRYTVGAETISILSVRHGARNPD